MYLFVYRGNTVDSYEIGPKYYNAFCDYAQHRERSISSHLLRKIKGVLGNRYE